MIVMCRIHGRHRQLGQAIELDTFELVTLNIWNSFASFVAIVSFETWHSQLDHIASSILSSLISSCHLGFVGNKHFDCLVCKLESW